MGQTEREGINAGTPNRGSGDIFVDGDVHD